MKKYIFVALCLGLYGCASGKTAIKATSPNTEVVTAEGMAPIINGDITGAKKTSLHEAMKSALGLVIGVYVSQEALVSKAILIEDNITSQTEGYIERYDVLKEWKDGDFYKTQIKALVRKEDLSAKIKSLDLEPKKLGNPVVGFKIDEYIDGAESKTTYAADELKKKFVDKGFVVADSGEPDILVSGRAEAAFNTDQGLGGMTSYRGTVSVKAVKPGSEDVITTAQETLGGVDVAKSAAAGTAISRAAGKVGADLPQTVLTYLKDRSTVQLVVVNIESINQLNDLVLAVRALIEVRDCKVRDYTGNVAKLDLDMKRGTASDVAKRLETMQKPLKVTKTSVYSIEAEITGSAAAQ